MIIKVNESQREISNAISLSQLISELKISTNGIAVAINNSIIKREDWLSFILQENDNVLIIKSTQGG